MSARGKPVNIRRNIESYGDPYLPELKPDEIAVCRQCQSVYEHGRWYLADQARGTSSTGETMETLCPACQKIRDHAPGGIATFTGSFLDQHLQEILNLVEHENRKAMEINPLERIMDMEQSKSCLVIHTTNEKLAQKLGRAVHKAYSGEVEYKWSEDNRLVRVYWHRDGRSEAAA